MTGADTGHWPYPFWIAHRGGGALAPENTMAAIRLAARLGWRMVELDAKLSSDGQLFLMHDATLERTTNGHGSSGACPWDELLRLDAGGWHSSAFAGESIPSFDTAVQWALDRGLMLDIEIKPIPGMEEETGRAVAERLLQLWVRDTVPPLVTSFRPESLAAARQVAPHLPFGLILATLWDGWDEVAAQLGCVAIMCDHNLWDEALMSRTRQLGLRALAYTVNDQQDVDRLIGLGIDGITSDRIDLFNLP